MQGELVRAIAQQRADLLAFLQQVRGDAWSRPTTCAPWTVKDVVAHLVEGELTIGRLYRGEARELGFVDPDEGVARWDALPGVAVRAALWQHGIATQRVLDAMSEAAWRQDIRAFGCRRMSQLVRLHLFDLAVHSWDLTSALEGPPLWGDRLPFIAAFVARAAPATLARFGVPADGALRVETPDAGWTVDGRSGSWVLTDDEAPATVRIDPESLVLATTGRLAVDEALARAVVDGDAAVAGGILGAWQVLAPSPQRA